MAIKTMSASSGGGSKFSEGFHEVEISSAEWGTYTSGDTEKKYIECKMKDYPDNMSFRVYEAHNKKTKEEFKISSLFKNANAGIVGVLKDPNGKNPLIQYDDDPKNLVGKAVQIYIYKEQKTGNEWNRVHEFVAPIVQTGDHISFNASEVEGIKKGIVKQVEKITAKPNEDFSAFENDDTSF